jgi:hypothetical protein
MQLGWQLAKSGYKIKKAFCVERLRIDPSYLGAVVSAKADFAAALKNHSSGK